MKYGAEGASREGGAYLYYGGPSGISPATVNVDPSMAYLGQAVASAGDVNGDGFADIIVADHTIDTIAGRAFVYLGSPSGPVAPALLLGAQDTNWGDGFGFSIAGTGDIDGTAMLT